MIIKMKEIIKISRKKKVPSQTKDQILKHCLSFKCSAGGQKSVKYAIKLI